MQAPDMANVSERQVSLRLPDDVVDRAEALAPVLGQLQAYRAFRVERATVFRLALIRGLEELEREHGAAAERVALAGERAEHNARTTGASAEDAARAREAAEVLTGLDARHALEEATAPKRTQARKGTRAAKPAPKRARAKGRKPRGSR